MPKFKISQKMVCYQTHYTIVEASDEQEALEKFEKVPVEQRCIDGYDYDIKPAKGSKSQVEPITR